MTINELLKQNGLTDEQIGKITAAMKENKIFTAGEENLDIRYGKLKTDFDGVSAQYKEAQTLIEQLKKSSKGNEDLQAKITGYENQIAQLQSELQENKLNSALKVALLEAKAEDVDYLTFKLKEKGELALDENEKIKGWDDKLATLKTQFPKQFATSETRTIEPNKLPNGEEGGALTKEQFAKMGYQERLKLFNESPEIYKELNK